MRWRAPCTDDERQCKGYLFFPKKIGVETRWLERAYWSERYMRICGRHVHYMWMATKWSDTQSADV